MLWLNVVFKLIIFQKPCSFPRVLKEVLSIPTPLMGSPVFLCILNAIYFSEMLLLMMPDCISHRAECLGKCLKGQFSYLVSTIDVIATYASNLCSV